MLPSSDGDRIHYLDWLKALIVYGIFVYHVALVFSLSPWLVANPQHSLILSLCTGFCYPWGLAAMFLIGGADAWLSLRNHSASEFVRARVLRLLVPLFVGMALLTPLQNYFISHNPPPSPVLLPAFYLDFLAHPRWEPLHLWFLGYLFAISMTALPVLLWLKTRTGGDVASWVAGVADRPGGLFALGIPLVISQLLLRSRFPAEESWADVAGYVTAFLFGALLLMNRRLELPIRRAVGPAVLIGLVSIAVIGLVIESSPGHSPAAAGLPRGVQALYAVAWGMDVWCWMLVVLWLGIRWLDHPNRVMRYVCDSILPFYVLHHPVVLGVASVVVALDLGVWPKFGLILTVALGITLVIYEFGVRRWLPMRVLFGLRPLAGPSSVDG